jgi:hypothetical protein
MPTRSNSGKIRSFEWDMGVFGDEAKAEPTGPTADVKTLHAKIGELTLENDFVFGALGKAGLLGTRKDRPRAGGHMTQSGLGDGPDLHPHGAGICLSLRRR